MVRVWEIEATNKSVCQLSGCSVLFLLYRPGMYLYIMGMSAPRIHCYVGCSTWDIYTTVSRKNDV